MTATGMVLPCPEKKAKQGAAMQRKTPLGRRLEKYSSSREMSSAGCPLWRMQNLPIGGMRKVMMTPAATARVCPAQTAWRTLERSLAPWYWATRAEV
ncbi:MAG: hypothetical protein L6W00_07875 [Lentisphaeria bacterium]|nr:MAG: hypothetical protein L6W00_07875 [Lentisphaeria bacterium]